MVLDVFVREGFVGKAGGEGRCEASAEVDVDVGFEIDGLVVVEEEEEEEEDDDNNVDDDVDDGKFIGPLFM